MSAIQSSIGLITGIPIQDTVNQLMTIAAQPRTNLSNRNSLLESERLAVDRLSSLVLAFQFDVNAISLPSAFQTKVVTSSDSTVVTAAIRSGGNPANGNYQFTAVQTASSQQLVSNSFQDLTSVFTDGTLSFRFGGFVDEGMQLSELNGGAGVEGGKIRVTDRSGATAIVDLRYAATVDDVLNAINNNTDVQVTASTAGDSFVLADSSGGSGNLIVQEVGSGKTAAALGLAGINTASTSATGNDAFSLHSGTKLSLLNDRNGVHVRSAGIDDLEIALRDESAVLKIDLGGSATLGDVIDKLNAADPARLAAAISSDGRRIELTDLTAGGGTFSVASVGQGTVAEDLGVATSTTDATITGGRLVAGLRDVLLARLNGGQGIGELGQIDITNRAGDTFQVDLSAAETLGDVVATINAQATGVIASVNTQRHGILLTDTTGASAGNLIVANGDDTNSADSLGIAIDQVATFVNSGTLNRQILSDATLLADLHHGKGVSSADIRVIDSAGVKAAIDLNSPTSPAVTIGDVIRAINSSNANVLARINDRGDGILIIDQAGGTGKLQVEEIGNGSAAKDLGILGLGVDSQGTQQIDGSFSYSIDLTDLASENEAVLLSSLNGGAGIDRGDFIIESSELGPDGATPRRIAIDLDGRDSDVLTVSQLIDRINTRTAAAGLGIQASINSSGTGILITDTAGGPGKLTVKNVGSDAAATDLGLTKASTTSGSSQTIDGAGKFTKVDPTQAGLSVLATRINNLNAGVTASTFNDGNGYRLSLAVNASGHGRELLIDTGDGVLSFQQASAAQDAILEFGNAGSGTFLRSNTNEFANVIENVNLSVQTVSEKPVQVDVSTNTTAIIARVREVVDGYNSIRDNLAQVASFNQDDLTTGILFGTSAALRVDTELSRVIGNRFSGLGQYDSLEAIGISLGGDGRLAFDTTKFRDAFTANPEAVTRLFTDKGTGFAAKVKVVTDSLAGSSNSMLSSRSRALTEVVELNSERIGRLDEQLARERERLLMQFFRLEETISGLQQSLTALNNLQIISPLTSTGRGATSLFSN